MRPEETKLSTSRDVWVTDFAMRLTFSGHLEGSPETITPYIIDRLDELCARILAPAKPLVIVREKVGTLPKWCCVARFESLRAVHHDDPDYSSFLYIAWFVDDLKDSVDAMSRHAVSKVDWDRHAEDFDIMSLY